MGMFDDILENVGEPYKANKGFEYGTHEVIIGEVKSVEKKTKNNDKAPVIEVTVFDEKDNEKTATCTLYFHTEGGAKMAVTKILGIFVHNVGEEKKDKVRELGKQLFSKVNDATEARKVAVKLMNDKMIGKKAYLVAEPNGKYKTTSYGDLWHYPAEPEGADERADSLLDGAEDITNKEEANEVPSFDEDDL
jgi:hypothetical protein